MKPLAIKRLEALEDIEARQRRTHFLFARRGETPAEVHARIERMVADGEAGADDRFVTFRWQGY